MDTQKLKPLCDVEVDSKPLDLNKGDDKKFASNKYAINPMGEFLKTMKRIFKGDSNETK